MSPTACQEIRLLLREHQEGRLPDAERERVEAHLAGCDGCRKWDAAERALTAALRERLPRYPASEGLRARLSADLAAGARSERPRERGPKRRERARLVMPFAAAALVLGLGFAVLVGTRERAENGAVVAEAVNDHLRVLYSERLVEIESGGIHQVKPWFSGRIDFAPHVAFDGDADFPLVGGRVAYFVDRKAATFVWRRRLHTISLFVMRGSGLAWPEGPSRPMGRLPAVVTSREGFHVVLFRDGDLAYALVSDVDESELLRLGAKIAG